MYMYFYVREIIVDKLSIKNVMIEIYKVVWKYIYISFYRLYGGDVQKQYR